MTTIEAEIELVKYTEVECIIGMVSYAGHCLQVRQEYLIMQSTD